MSISSSEESNGEEDKSESYDHSDTFGSEDDGEFLSN